MLRPLSSSSVKASWILGLVLGTRGAMGGYLNVNMEPANQCGHSLVEWSGDDGPYHLLLTPTSHAQHGYNVWLPTIPNGTYSYNLAINQPQGLQFVLTMWGASGISFAGTTDVLTVGAPATPTNGSCFLTDDEILGLYSFSFNISDTSSNLPPQCSNLTMSWPTSLESNVTGVLSRAVGAQLDDVFEEISTNDTALHRLDSSTSDHRGNTSYPPSMFGVIPLGNSFSIPITYARDSKYAKYLPDSSRSDDPTTWTTTGVTYLNWTVPLAKGTRFILVAGIGSDQQWASGGSSALLTVGQGSTECAFTNTDGGPDAAPSVTATTGTYNPEQTDQSGTGGTSTSSGSNTIVKTALACVLSVLATLLIIGLFFFCRRVRRKRREPIVEGYNYPSGSLRKLNRAGAGSYASEPMTPDTPLDLIASRNGSRIVAPILTDTAGHVDSPVDMSPLGAYDERRGNAQDPFASRRDTRMSSPLTSPTSPLADRHRMLVESGRQSSLDPLLTGSGYGTALTSPIGETYPGTVSTHRPLMLHDRTMGLPFEGEEEEGDVSELKRETLAMGESSGSTGVPTPRRQGTAPPRRRRDRDEGMDYVVHRDAGRVRNEPDDGRRVLELPPRYEELNWEEGEEASNREREGTR